MKGKIHSFQSMGTVDGPGIRSVVFMQGCPLRCACCHNPDTWSFESGQEYDSDEIVKKVTRFKSYFGSKGGITVSGGEPLMQSEFVREVFIGIKNNGLSTCLDTSGCILNDKVKSLLDVTDYVLLDYKYSNEVDYKKYTLCEKQNVICFLDYLEGKQISTVIRRVIIPTLNDDERSYEDLKLLKNKYSCIKKIELLPFRKLCVEKYQQMGLEFPLANFDEPNEKEVKLIEAIIN